MPVYEAVNIIVDLPCYPAYYPSSKRYWRGFVDFSSDQILSFFLLQQSLVLTWRHGGEDN